MKKYHSLLILIILFLSACGNLNDPTQTTQVNTFVAPTLSAFTLSRTNLLFTAQSYSDENDFEGFNIYFSDDASDLDELKNLQISNYSDLADVPYLLLPAQIIPNDDLAQNRFHSLGIEIVSNWTINASYYLAAKTYGSNIYFASIYDTQAWLESAPSDTYGFTVPQLSTAVLTNNVASTAQSALNYSGLNFSETSGNADENNITAAFFFTLKAFGSEIYPVLKTGNAVDGGLIAGGLLEGIETVVDLPEDHYLQSSFGVPVAENQVYFFKDGDLYAKIFVSELSSEASAIGDSIYLSMDIYAITNTGLLRF